MFIRGPTYVAAVAAAVAAVGSCPFAGKDAAPVCEGGRPYGIVTAPLRPTSTTLSFFLQPRCISMLPRLEVPHVALFEEVQENQPVVRQAP